MGKNREQREIWSEVLRTPSRAEIFFQKKKRERKRAETDLGSSVTELESFFIDLDVLAF